MKNINKDERGIVAIVVTVLVMLVITITTVGMSRIATREQRQVIDRQLSTQAYFAAESGINDMLQKIQADIAAGAPLNNISDCSQTNTIRSQAVPGPAGANKNQLWLDDLLTRPTVLDTQASSQYSCAMAFFDPTSLEYSQVTSNPDKAVVADVTIPAGFAQTVVVGWEDYQGGTRFRTGTSCGEFDVGTHWNAAPLVKLDITDLEGTDYSRTDLMNRTASYYLDPCQGTAPFTPVAQTFTPGTANASNGTILSGRCDNSATHDRSDVRKPLRCNVNIGLSAPGYPGGASNRFLIRLKTVYGSARMAVLALDAGNNPLNMKGAQTVIDVTGKAGDIVKRTQVRVSNRSPYLYTVESAGAICKRIAAIEPPNATIHTMPTNSYLQEDFTICDPRDTRP